MKKIFVSALVVTMALIASCSNDEQAQAMNGSSIKLKSDETSEIMEDFKKYKVTIDFPRVISSEYPKGEKTAKSFALVSYSDMIVGTYTINGDEYNDEGRLNDLEAGDGIYTSLGVYEPAGEFDPETLIMHKFPEFTQGDLLQEEFANQTLGKRKPVKIGKGIKGAIISAAVDFLFGCDYSYTFAGSSSLGVPCSPLGCLIVDC